MESFKILLAGLMKYFFHEIVESFGTFTQKIGEGA